MGTHIPGRVPSLTAILLGACALGAASARAQGPLVEPDEAPPYRPALWSVEFDFGTRAPGVIYDAWIERRTAADTLGPLRTHLREKAEGGWHGRFTVRLRPENGVGAYASIFRGMTNTRARFAGGRERPDTVLRSVSFMGFETGITMKLKEWAGGRGVFEYNIGPVFLRQRLDLTPGHRNSLAVFSHSQRQKTFEWSSRTFSGWGFSLGSGFRFPLRDDLSLRFMVRDWIIPVNTTQIAIQEREEIRDFTGTAPTLQYNEYTAHMVSLSFGFEYTFAWDRVRERVERRLPAERRKAVLAPEVRNAMRLAADGDTATAVAALTHRLSIMPDDALAWRELSLMRAAAAETDVSKRVEALETLRRALNMNPGDMDVLRAYGRIRGLVELDARNEVPAPPEEPLALSELAVRADREGGVQLGWAVHGLATPAEGEAYGYRVEVEVLTEAGERVPVRPFGGPFRRTDEDRLVAEGTADQLPVEGSLNLFLTDGRPGFYTVRVFVTDLTSGGRVESSGGFEIPEDEVPDA